VTLAFKLTKNLSLKNVFLSCVYYNKFQDKAANKRSSILSFELTYYLKGIFSHKHKTAVFIFRFYTGKKSLEEIRQRLDVFTSTVDKSYLMFVKLPDVFICGLEHIVSHVHPKTLEKYRPLLNATISSDSASTIIDRQVSVS